jgi:hypothetical protein
MMEMFGGMFVMMLFAYSVVPLLPFVYVLLRWRQAREGEPADPQLGLKVALYYFATLGLHVVLIGAVALLYSLMLDGPSMSERLMRLGAGLALGGGLVYAIHRVLIARLTDPARRARVARVFAGLNVVVCGLIGMGCLIATAVMLLQESVPEDAFKLTASLLVVYLGGWALQARTLVRLGEAP